MDNEKLENVPNVSINELINILTKTYISFINNNIDLKSCPSAMLWGAPGVGKSQSVRQIAKNIEKETKKKVNITDVRLLLFNPIDLRGIPVANKDKTLAVWLKPKIFEMENDKNVINILFLDEISACTPSVQASAYQITLDRTIGEHKLPDNCFVIAAGNRLKDKSVVSKMPKALANRMMHFEIKQDFNAWKEWAINHNVNSDIISFLSNNKNYLLINQNNDNLAYATPRTWEMVSNVLNNVDCTPFEIEYLVSSLVGNDVALEFMEYLNLGQDMPNVEDIFMGEVEYKPLSDTKNHVLYKQIISYMNNKKPKAEWIVNAFEYMTKMPIEYSIMFVKKINDYSVNAVVSIQESELYNEWMKKVKETNVFQ